jgi:hypothetical protein
MSYYNFIICNPAGTEIFYDRNSDDLMQELNIVVDGSNLLTEDEKTLIRKEVYKELERIRSLFEQNENNFVIYDSFQDVKERKFSIEFLKDNTIKVIKLEEEENEL